MSWLSSAFRSKAVQSIAKPLVSHIPIVGDFAASRILMSPTAAETQVSQNVAAAVPNLVDQVKANVALVKQEQAAAGVVSPAIAAPAPLTGPVMTGTPPGGSSSSFGGMSQQQLVFIGLGLVIVLVLMSRNGR